MMYAEGPVTSGNSSGSCWGLRGHKSREFSDGLKRSFQEMSSAFKRKADLSMENLLFN